MKKTIYIIILFLQFSILNSSENNYCDYKIGDTLDVISHLANYKMRLYIFTSLNSCEICNLYLNRLQENINFDSVELVIFVSGVSSYESDSLKNQFGWKGRIISDEFNIYKNYFKIKYYQTILILDNKGILLEKGKLSGRDLTINKIMKIYDDISYKITNEEEKDVDLIQTMFIKNNNKKFKYPIYRRILYNFKSKEFYLTGNTCNIYVIDSLGNIIKSINNKTAMGIYKCFNMYYIDWAIQDSILFLYYAKKDMEPYFQFLNIKSYKLSKERSINIIKVKGRDRWSYESFYLKGRDKFILYTFENGPKNRYMNLNEKTLFEYNTNGVEITSFDTPDSLYNKYSISDWFTEILLENNHNNYVTLQNFSNKLKIWDKKFNLLKVNELDLGTNFRKIKFDFTDTLNINTIWNSISILYSFQYDPISGNYLICYLNHTYPPDENDYTSDRIKYDSYINIYNERGERINKKTIHFNQDVKPFLFFDSKIYTSEFLDKNLVFRIYKF